MHKEEQNIQSHNFTLYCLWCKTWDIWCFCSSNYDDSCVFKCDIV